MPTTLSIRPWPQPLPRMIPQGAGGKNYLPWEKGLSKFGGFATAFESNRGTGS